MAFLQFINKAISNFKNYLEHTYRRLLVEDKIAYTSDNKYACFNTGLVTPNLEDLFVYCERNKNESGRADFCPYFFKAFLKKSDMQIVRNFSDHIPAPAFYFDNPEKFIFNPSFELIPNLDHIIQDNSSRFPPHLQAVSEADLRRHLVGAIDEAKKKARRNYKVAIPQMHGGIVQLLLPLCLTPNSPNPDLALVVHQIEQSNTYTSRTCLTLEMAYNNARLIVQPQSDWLKP